MSDMRLTNTSVVRAGGRLLAGATSGARMLPGFLVIGTKRGGSTSLYEYLIRHPDVAGCLLTKGSNYFDVNFGRGWSWFRAAFPLAGGRRTIAGEASPYYMFHPLAPQRIAAALPEVRLIAVLRDPVERAWSHYRYERHRGYEDLPFEEALRREPERLAGEAERMVAEPGYSSFAHRHLAYLARGRYAEQLERIHALIPPSWGGCGASWAWSRSGSAGRPSSRPVATARRCPPRPAPGWSGSSQCRTRSCTGCPA